MMMRTIMIMMIVLMIGLIIELLHIHMSMA